MTANLQLAWHLRETISELGTKVEDIASSLLRRGFMVQIRDGCDGEPGGNSSNKKQQQQSQHLGGNNGNGSGAHHVTKKPIVAAKRDCLKDLRGHRFMTCTGFQGGWAEEPLFLREPLIIEPRFKDQFVIKFGATDLSYRSVLAVRSARCGIGLLLSPRSQRFHLHTSS